MPRLKACQSHATVERAGEAPRSSEVGSGIGSLRKSVGCTRRTAPLDVTPIASTSDPTARRGSTRSLRHVRKSTRSRALLYDEPVKRHVAPKLAAALEVSENLSAAHGERRRSMLLQSPVRATRRQGAAVHAPPSRSKEPAITRAIARRASEAPYSSEVSRGIDSPRKAVGCAERKTPLCVTLIADASDATAGRNHTRALRIVHGSPRTRALSYDAPVKQHEARSRQRRWPSPECRRLRRGNGTVRCYFIR